jgi:lipoprotein-anchoring transpeptidase ErfK/SrfK
MGYKLFIFIAIVFSLTASYFSKNLSSTTPRIPASQYMAGEVVNSDSATAVTAPDVLVVVDRNPAVQTMQVYLNGSSTAANTFKVSTGRETFDFPPLGGNPYCSFTATGEFKPGRMRELHLSNTWRHPVVGPDGKPQTDASGESLSEGSPMPYSMFFNGGIATHSTIPATDGNIGKIASGGCVRMHPDDAKTLFDYVALKDANGDYVRVNPRTYDEQCMNTPVAKPLRTAGSHTAENTGSGVAHGAHVIPGSLCTDESQWPIKKQNVNVKIQVVDSRPLADQRCLEQQCAALETGFKLEKEACLRKRVLASSNVFERVSLGANFDLKRKMESMKSEDREKLTRECNSELAVDYKAHPRQKMDCTKSLPIPIPQPRPTWRDVNGNPSKTPVPAAGARIPLVDVVNGQHPVPPVDIIEPVSKDPATPKNDNIEGLWAKEYKRR